MPRCMGRSRDRLTTKIHAFVDPYGDAISLKLTEGNRRHCQPC